MSATSGKLRRRPVLSTWRATGARADILPCDKHSRGTKGTRVPQTHKPGRIISYVVLGWNTFHPNTHVQDSKLLPHGVDQAILVELLRRACKC